MEKMLKSWFPNIKLQDQLSDPETEEAVPTKKLKVKLLKSRSVAQGLVGYTTSTAKNMW